MAVWIVEASEAPVDFNTQVKPIINKKCISCHGGVKRQGGFSLLFRSEALASTESGKPAIIPGKPDQSEMIHRLAANDPEERMPYKEEALEPSEIRILRRWISEGANWGDHWAYLPVREVEIPEPDNSWFRSPDDKNRIKNDIDYFIYDKLRQEKLSPSPRADKATLLRRVSLDLIGIPPSRKLADGYLNANGDDAYEALVDSLLASPHFGERWASMWMDIARYADTKGYESDYERKGMWKYRDWLIRAFNADKPYDEFITEQIAGDLFPEPTDEQYIATAFHRNTLSNDEGGTDNEEFRTAAVLDRVNTTWEGLMSTTFACVQCHSHPYDPFTHDEYYKFLAFFNNTRDEDNPDDYPLLRQFDSSANRKLMDLRDWVSKNAGVARAKEVYTFLKTWEPSINSIKCDDFHNAALAGMHHAEFRNGGYCRIKHVNLDGKSKLIYRFNTRKAGGTLKIRLDKPDGPLLHSVSLKFTNRKWEIAEFGFDGVEGVHDLYFVYSHPDLSDPRLGHLLFDWLYFTDEFPGKGKPGYETAYASFWELLNAPASTTPIMMPNPPDLARPTHVFERGNWLAKGEEVQPDVPHSLNPMPADAPHNRLGLARWLTDKKNPLVARTMVNRLWEQVFGNGLVETLEDMGTQGIPPTHKELLDHLSWKFMNDYQWSVKRLLKEIVTSGTYMQDSRITDGHLQQDPYNRFYTRGPRVRLSAEQIRDQALFACGLLSDKMYGPSVMPWQPEGIWLFRYNDAKWQKSEGEDQYRRAVYTFWKRSSPYPSMISFDGVARTMCAPRRIRSNTPLQALVTLNDSVYLEAARHLARQMQKEARGDTRQQINKGYELVMYKPINTVKQASLEKLYQKSLETFRSDSSKAAQLLGYRSPAGGRAVLLKNDQQELAALTVVANAILNLNEVITKS